MSATKRAAMTQDELYQGHSGLYSLSIELERVISKIDERREKGWVADKKIVKRLRELNVNLKVLSKEWQRTR